MKVLTKNSKESLQVNSNCECVQEDTNILPENKNKEMKETMEPIQDRKVKIELSSKTQTEMMSK